MAYFLYKFYLETFSNSPEQYRMTVFYGELRVVAVCANVAMITYAWGVQIYPVLALQSCLLPK